MSDRYYTSGYINFAGFKVCAYCGRNNT